MRRPFIVGVAVAGLCLAWVGHAGALPTPVSSSIDFFVQASVGTSVMSGSDTDAQGATINPLAATASAAAVSGAASATAHASGAATWVNPAQGQVLLFDIGWETANDAIGGVDTGLGNDWRYTFVADATDTFTLDWSIVASGTDTGGLNGFIFRFTGGSDQLLDINTNGILTRPVIGGGTYTVQIENLAAFGRGDLGDRTADMDGTFNFSMTTVAAAVPQPASFVLLGVGLLAAALVKRRAV